MMRRRSGQRGYSLIEALVVVAIVGVVSLVTVPNFITMYRASKIKSAVREFSTSLRDARQNAVTKNRRVMLSLGTSTSERSKYYYYEEIGGSWSPAAGEPRNLEQAAENMVVYFKDSNFTDVETADGKSRKDIIFSPDGTVNLPVALGGEASVTIRTDDDIPKQEYVATITPAGSVRME